MHRTQSALILLVFGIATAACSDDPAPPGGGSGAQDMGMDLGKVSPSDLSTPRDEGVLAKDAALVPDQPSITPDASRDAGAAQDLAGSLDMTDPDASAGLDASMAPDAQMMCQISAPLRCAQGCVDPMSDVSACGDCDTTCDPGQLCEQGMCVKMSLCATVTCGMDSTCDGQTGACQCNTGFFACSTGCCPPAPLGAVGSIDASVTRLGGTVSLAIDARNLPHVAYQDDQNSDLKYAFWDGTMWQSQIVDAPGSVGSFASIALDALARPHIAYYDASGKNLKYAVWTAGAWQIQTVDATGDVGVSASLAIDSKGHPHIAYKDDTRYRIKHAAWDGVTWKLEDVDSGNGKTRLALDAQDRPAIAYQKSASQVSLATWDGMAWQTQRVHEPPAVNFASTSAGNYSDLKLDASGFPHILTHDFRSYVLPSDRILHLRWDGTQWVSTLVYSGDDLTTTNLALDASGKVHLSYNAGSGSRLAYAMLPPPGGIPPSATTIANDTRAIHDLALDTLEHPHLIYVSKTKGLMYARYDGTAWLK